MDYIHFVLNSYNNLIYNFRIGIYKSVLIVFAKKWKILLMVKKTSLSRDWGSFIGV